MADREQRLGPLTLLPKQIFGDPIDIGFLGLFSDMKRTSGAAFFVDPFRFHRRDQRIGFLAYPRSDYPEKAKIIISHRI